MIKYSWPRSRTVFLFTSFYIIFVSCGRAPSKLSSSLGEPPVEGEPSSTTITRITTNVCTNFKNSLTSIGVKDGFILAPENWDAPQTSRKIWISYFYRPAKNPNTAVDYPIVFFNGGPASDSHYSLKLLNENNAFDDFNIYLIDQRGTGCSDLYPTWDNNLNKLSSLQYYGISSIIKDAEAIRKANRGDRKWIVYGQSFGGTIAAKYLALAPEGIHSIFMHGSSVDISNQTFIKNRIRGQKRVSEEYFSLYPEDRKILAKIRNMLKADDCFSSTQMSICGSGVFDSFFILLGFKNEWSTLHKSINDLGNIPLLNRTFLRTAVQNYILPKIETAVSLEALAIGSLTSGGDLREDCRQGMREAQTSGVNLNDVLIMDCRLYNSTSLPWDAHLKLFTSVDDISFDDFTDALLKNPKIRLHLYSGEYDSFVPKESMESLLRWGSSRLKYHHFPVSGHEGYYTETKIAEDMKLLTK